MVLKKSVQYANLNLEIHDVFENVKNWEFPKVS